MSLAYDRMGDDIAERREARAEAASLREAARMASAEDRRLDHLQRVRETDAKEKRDELKFQRQNTFMTELGRTLRANRAGCAEERAPETKPASLSDRLSELLAAADPSSTELPPELQAAVTAYATEASRQKVRVRVYHLGICTLVGH